MFAGRSSLTPVQPVLSFQRINSRRRAGPRFTLHRLYTTRLGFVGFLETQIDPLASAYLQCDTPNFDRYKTFDEDKLGYCLNKIFKKKIV